MEGHACFQPVLNPTNAEKVQGKTNTLYMTALTLLVPSYPKFFANLDNYTVYTKCNDLPGVHSKHILPYFQAEPYIPVCTAQYQNYMQPIAY